MNHSASYGETTNESSFEGPLATTLSEDQLGEHSRLIKPRSNPADELSGEEKVAGCLEEYIRHQEGLEVQDERKEFLAAEVQYLWHSRAPRWGKKDTFWDQGQRHPILLQESRLRLSLETKLPWTWWSNRRLAKRRPRLAKVSVS
jgi:hypothetical protein